ncbi:MAG TPA: serine/threonine-protein kinase [Amycolatopsis sp.]|nr:serine/threonine-protein kinase [Amycolatopsis sp.]
MRCEPGFDSRLIAQRYRLTGYLGRGGMADVYRAFDLTLERPVAVKMFRSGGDDSERRRFEEEARLLARLHHPGLVSVYDAGFSEGEPFLVMRLIEGQTLSSRLAEGPLAAPEVLDLGRQLSSILAYVHDVEVVHRDVKPSNVLLDHDGRAFLADFGISRLLNTVTRVTATGKIMGTVGYLAPEQVLGADATPAIDVYALGLVLLECVTGMPEYEGCDAETALARLHRRPRVPAGLSAPLATTIHAMTATKPELRPTMAECADLLAGRVPAAPPHRRWVLLGATVTGAAAVAAVSWVLLGGSDAPFTQAPPSTTQPAAPTSSSPPVSPSPAPVPTSGTLASPMLITATSQGDEPSGFGARATPGPTTTTAVPPTTTTAAEPGTTTGPSSGGTTGSSTGNGNGKSNGNGGGNGNGNGGATNPGNGKGTPHG